MLAPPGEGDWDIKGTNFKARCYLPYWHESHHVVPNSTLRAAIADVGKGTADPRGVTRVVRGGLLDEGYNLNDKRNMIILPMDRDVGLALGLPKHRKTKDHRSHSAYSKHVKDELEEIFKSIRSEALEHQKKPKYRNCRKRIEICAKGLYEAIKAAGERMGAEGGSDDSLDDMKKAELAKSGQAPGLETE